LQDVGEHDNIIYDFNMNACQVFGGRHIASGRVVGGVSTTTAQKNN
jgi:hypothetical protein